MIHIFKDNFSQEDARFIDEIHARFPEKDMQFKFNLFLMVKPESRIEQAHEMRKDVIRTGWHRRGIPSHETETLDQHVEGMKVMARNNIPNHPELPIILKTIDGHDDGETIIGDFDKQDKMKISKPEKHRLEGLAMGLIYESAPHMLQHWVDFEERNHFAGKFSVDIDAAQMCERRMAYALTHPHIDLSEFDNYFQALEWQTEQGKSIYQKLLYA